MTENRASGRSSNRRQARRQRDREEFKSLGSRLRFSSLDLQISEERMTVRADRITADVSADDILAMLDQEGITAGIDHEAIRIALLKANSGHNQFGVTLARGRQPKGLKPSTIVHHLPPELITDKSRAKAPFERLKAALDGSSLEACKSWRGPVKFVRQGELLSELVAPETEPGFDVYGQELTLEARDDLRLQAGDNATLSEDGSRCTADLCGYAGAVAGVSAVLSPIWMSPDCMEAHFVLHPPSDGPPTIDRSDLMDALKMKWIEFGVLDKQLDLIVRRLTDRQPLPSTVPVAQGVPAIPGEEHRVERVFDPGDLMKWSQLQGVLGLQTSQAVEQAFSHIYNGDQESGSRFTAVEPAEMVVQMIPGTPGVVGTDIQGEEATPEERERVPLEAREGLMVSDDGLRTTAQWFGYAALWGDTETTLLSPLWISPDRTSAHFLNLPQSRNAKYPNLEQMQDLLNRAGIVYGYDAERWSNTLRALEAGGAREFLLPVATGTSPRQAADAEFEWVVQTESYAPGKILDDGSIDFRDRNLASLVGEGDLLGRLVPSVLGTTGRDIFGEELVPPPPAGIEVVTGAYVCTKPEESGSMAFFSEVGGGISTSSSTARIGSRWQKRINIAVYPVATIEGNVDYESGNIDFNGDVVIKGSVQSQFIVKATGTVTIGGYVEGGP